MSCGLSGIGLGWAALGPLGQMKKFDINDFQVIFFSTTSE